MTARGTSSHQHAVGTGGCRPSLYIAYLAWYPSKSMCAGLHPCYVRCLYPFRTLAAPVGSLTDCTRHTDSCARPQRVPAVRLPTHANLHLHLHRKVCSRFTVLASRKPGPSSAALYCKD